jgi:hypothetical protein
MISDEILRWLVLYGLVEPPSRVFELLEEWYDCRKSVRLYRMLRSETQLGDSLFHQPLKAQAVLGRSTIAVFDPSTQDFEYVELAQIYPDWSKLPFELLADLVVVVRRVR